MFCVKKRTLKDKKACFIHFLLFYRFTQKHAPFIVFIMLKNIYHFFVGNINVAY